MLLAVRVSLGATYHAMLLAVRASLRATYHAMLLAVRVSSVATYNAMLLAVRVSIGATYHSMLYKYFDVTQFVGQCKVCNKHKFLINACILWQISNGETWV
jgi:hypothetical protein